MVNGGWVVRAFAYTVKRVGGALALLALMASCDSGMSPQATNAPLPDVSASEAQAGPEAGADDGKGVADEASADATVGPSDAAGARDATLGDTSADSARSDGAPGLGLDATDLDAPGPDPAPVPCGADAAEAGFCPLPNSVCANSRWLVFYDNAQCVSGSCTWEKRYVDCGSIGCFVGRCQPPFTM
jgi:hypothetical protein